MNWKEYRLEELLEPIRGAIKSGPFGSNISSKFFVEAGVPVIRGNNLSIGSTKFIDSGFVFVTEEKAKELDCWADHNDIIFTAAGTIGQVGIIGADSAYPRYVISNKQIRARLNALLVDPLFAYYSLSSPASVTEIVNSNTGTSVPLINLSIVRKLRLQLPSLPVQQRIAEVLSSLDDKIELNRQMNQTLEEMAQAIFKHYFVDGIDEDSLPAGWKMKSIGELLTHSKTAVNPANSPSTLYHHYSLPSFDELHYPSAEYGSQIMSNKGSVTRKCILFSKLNPRFPRIWPVLNPQTDAIASTEFLILEPNEPYYSYVYCLLSSKEFMETLVPKATGTSSSHQRVRPSDILDEKVALSETMCAQFEGQVLPLVQLMDNNIEEIQNLAATRDYLLPKLISGEVVPADLKRLEQTL